MSAEGCERIDLVSLSPGGAAASAHSSAVICLEEAARGKGDVWSNPGG